MTSLLFSVFLLLQTGAAPVGVRVSGEITRERSQVGKTQVRLLSPSTGAVQYTDIAADGSFQFFNVQPGAYQLVAGPSIAMQPMVITQRRQRHRSANRPDGNG